MPSRPISLALVNDHALIRQSLKVFLSEQDNIQVVLQATDSIGLPGKLKNFPVDVLLIDISMPAWNMKETLKTIQTEHPAIKILVLLMSADPDLISDMLEFGIHGYISITDEPEELLQAIQTAAGGHVYQSKYFTEALYRKRENSMNTFPAGSPVMLTEREKKIIQLIWEEKNTNEIASEVFLGVRSIEKIRQDIKEKVGVKSTVGLLKYAIDNKIVGDHSNRTEMGGMGVN